ncbi:MAG TPA: HEAT repeat domain-containing protein [Candidatus Acidoferrum sp.]|nr:HEAT repeat domain-containing protein [Candidatus Acidoferrum sp.]
MFREPAVPNARAFVRSFNVLLKFARLYGLAHNRSAGQFDVAWGELQECLAINGETGLLLGVSGWQLLLDGEPLESTAAERSFAELLTTAGVASIGFTRRIEKDEFAELVRVFAESGAKAGPLAERLGKAFGANASGGIRVNEIRFVAEDAALSDTRLAAQLTAKTLGVDGTQLQDWFRSPEKMIQLIAAAEGSHGQGGFGVAGNGSGRDFSAAPGAGSAISHATDQSAPGGNGARSESTSAAGGVGLPGSISGIPQSAVRGTPGGVALPLGEAEIRGLLRLLVQFGEATQSDPQFPPHVWQEKVAALPPNAQAVLRQALASIVAKKPNAKLDESMLLQLAEDLAIRFALEQFERGEVRVNAVRQMLDGMNREIESLRKLLKAREEKMAGAGLAVDTRADILDRQFWAAVPESGKRNVLTSPEAWCVPPRNVQQYVDELLTRGESEAAGNVLSKYAACVCNSEPEARKKAAIGLGQLAGVYSKVASQGLQQALMQTGQQMLKEQDPEIETLLSAAFVRLSQESASRRYFCAMQQALDSLADLEEHRPTWVQSLRPRTGIENRIPDFIDEVLAAETLPEGFLGVLMRLPERSAEHLGVRLGRVTRSSERESIVEIAESLGAPCKRQLTELLKTAPLTTAANAVGLLSRVDPGAVQASLSIRLGEGGRAFHDAIVRQLSIGAAPERARILCSIIGTLDRSVVPLALDEVGMCGDASLAPELLKIAEATAPNVSDYVRVKAVEALGRLRAPESIGLLRQLVQTRKRFGWLHPEEIRIAAAQALMKFDQGWIREFLPQSGLDPRIVSLAPLDAAPRPDMVRYRRHRRVRFPRSVPAVVISPRGKCSSAISVMSLEGGLLDSDVQLAVGTEATLKIQAGIRPISMQAVVRFVRPRQAGFEMVGMGLDDRAKLRSLLVSIGASEPPTQG